jgi:hypothetical protein
MPRALVKSISWLPKNPLRLEEGPIVEQKVYQHRGWAAWNDASKMRALRTMAVEYGRDPRMRWFTVNTVLRPAGVDFRDYERTAATMLAWVQRNIYYTNEPGEQIQAPWWTIKYKTGDCDDMALLLASMAESVRMPWKFALGGHDRKGKAIRYIEGEREPRGVTYSHIYLYLGWPPFKPQKWAAAEPTLKGAPLGYDVVLQGARGAGAPLPELAGYDLGHVDQGWGELGLFPRMEAKTRSEIIRDVIIGISTGVVTSVMTALIVERITRKKR